MMPSDEEDLSRVRALLAQEAQVESQGREREEDLAILSCVQLFRRGLLEDVLPI